MIDNIVKIHNIHIFILLFWQLPTGSGKLYVLFYCPEWFKIFYWHLSWLAGLYTIHDAIDQNNQRWVQSSDVRIGL